MYKRQVIQDEFKEEYFNLDGEEEYWHLILVCIASDNKSEEIHALAKKKYGNQQMVNVADKPALCDFFFGANATLGGGLQLMISSNGISPTLGGIVRDEITRHFQSMDFDESMKRLGDLRVKIRKATTNPSGPDKPEDIQYRMRWIKTCLLYTSRCV